MNLFKKKTTLYLACSVNSIAMIAIMFIWLNQFLILDDEVLLIRATTWAERLFKSTKPDPKNFLFIDLTWEKKMQDEKNEDGDIIGKRPVTDRRRIAELLHSLNKNKDYKFIILDVFFKDSTNYADDSLLQSELSKAKNILIPYHKGDNDQADLPIFKAPLALSDYEQNNDQFVKFKLVQGNGFHTTPLVMYETLHKDSLQDGLLFYSMNNRLSMNSFILNLRIWWNDFRKRETDDLGKKDNSVIYTKYYFNDLLIGPEEVYNPIIHEASKNRIIVIGAFDEGDNHDTVYGDTPGPLILLNVYLAILNKDNLIPWTFILFLFAGFFIISYKCFSNVDFLELILSKSSNKGAIHKLFSIAGYLLYFILLSLLSYFLYNIHLTVLVLSFYMEAVEYIKEFIEKRREKKGILESLVGEN
jgi:hypothetical protein